MEKNHKVSKIGVKFKHAMHFIHSFINNIPNVISQMGSGRVEHPQTLHLPHRDRVVSNRLSPVSSSLFGITRQLEADSIGYWIEGGC